jgi:hypothetical protein
MRFNQFGKRALAVSAMGLTACAGAGPLPDLDGDGLADSWEEEGGIVDPLLLDTDGDGWTDGEEVYGFADPTDDTDHPYIGEWPRGPWPADLESNGVGVGDIAEDFLLQDQFGENVKLWSFYGQVVLIENAAPW